METQVRVLGTAAALSTASARVALQGAPKDAARISVPGDAASRATAAMRSVTDWLVLGLAIRSLIPSHPRCQVPSAGLERSLRNRRCAGRPDGADPPSRWLKGGRGEGG